MATTPTITAQALFTSQRAAPQSTQVIDVRSCGEFFTEHLPGAINIPIEEIESRFDDLKTDLPVVLVCQSGKRACMAAELLAANVPRIFVLEGGLAAWSNSGLPTVSTRKVRWSLERQIRLGAGLLVLISLGLGELSSPLWRLLAAVVGAGLVFAGATDICGMGLLLARMPWNRAKQTGAPCSVSDTKVSG